MAFLFADGFDCYANDTQWIEANWSRSASTPVLNTSEGRFGGGCMKNTGTGIARIGTFVATGNTVIVGFSFKHSGGTSSPNTLVKGVAISGAAQLFRIEYTNGGDLKAYNQPNAQVGSTATAALTANTWYWIEIKVVLGTGAADGSIEVKVDGTSLITVGSIDTNTGEPLVGLHFGGQATSGSTHWFDDVVILDNQGAAPTNFIGTTRIDTYSPNAAGGVTNWTPSASTQLSCVDDTPNATNDDTDYIESSTVAQEARFGIGDLTVSPDAIHAVQVRVRAKKPDAGPRTMRSLLNVSSSEAVGPTVGLPTNYAWVRAGIFRDNPNTSAPFTATGFNAMQAGVEVVA